MSRLRMKLPIRRTAIALALLALGVLLRPAASAQDANPEHELLHLRTEQIRDDARFAVLGAPIAAKRLLPELYARHGFERIWTNPAAPDLRLAEAPPRQPASASNSLPASGSNPERSSQ